MNTSQQTGQLLLNLCSYLQNVRTDSDGYAKLINRCVIDLEWYSNKLIKNEQEIYVPIHLKTPASEAVSLIQESVNKLKGSLNEQP